MRQLGDGNTYLRGFVTTTGIFTVAHGVFVLLLVFLFGVGGPLRWEDARIALAGETLQAAAAQAGEQEARLAAAKAEIAKLLG